MVTTEVVVLSLVVNCVVVELVVVVPAGVVVTVVCTCLKQANASNKEISSTSSSVGFSGTIRSWLA